MSKSYSEFICILMACKYTFVNKSNFKVVITQKFSHFGSLQHTHIETNFKSPKYIKDAIPQGNMFLSINELAFPLLFQKTSKNNIFLSFNLFKKVPLK